jgi:hypothetical protein
MKQQQQQLLLLLGLLVQRTGAFCRSSLTLRHLCQQRRLAPVQALVDARQVTPDVQKDSWANIEFNTPKTMPQAIKTFFSSTTPKLSSQVH